MSINNGQMRTGRDGEEGTVRFKLCGPYRESHMDVLVQVMAMPRGGISALAVASLLVVSCRCSPHTHLVLCKAEQCRLSEESSWKVAFLS